MYISIFFLYISFKIQLITRNRGIPQKNGVSLLRYSDIMITFAAKLIKTSKNIKQKETEK